MLNRISIVAAATVVIGSLLLLSPDAALPQSLTQNRARMKAANEKKKKDLEAKKKKAVGDAAAKDQAERYAKEKAEEDIYIAINKQEYAEHLEKIDSLLKQDPERPLSKDFGPEAERLVPHMETIFGRDGYRLISYPPPAVANGAVESAFRHQLSKERDELAKDRARLKAEQVTGFRDLSDSAREREREKLGLRIDEMSAEIVRLNETLMEIASGGLRVGCVAAESRKTGGQILVYFCTCDTGTLRLYHEEKIVDFIDASLVSAKNGLTPKIESRRQSRERLKIK